MRSNQSLRSMAILKLGMLTCLLCCVGPGRALADSDIVCRLDPIVGAAGADLGGRFQYHVEAPSVENSRIESHVLVLGEDGRILEELPLENGDVVQLAIRDKVFTKSSGNRVRWLVAVDDDPAVIHERRPGTEGGHVLHTVRDENDGSTVSDSV